MKCRTPAPEVIKRFPCSTQLSTKFILLINVKMPTFISMINTISERLKARHFFICWYFSFYEHFKFRAQFRAQLSRAWKQFYNIGARCTFIQYSTNKYHSTWLVRRFAVLETTNWNKFKDIQTQEMHKIWNMYTMHRFHNFILSIFIY